MPDARQQIYTDPARSALFTNADADTAPAFCLLEIVGWDDDRQAFRVTRPSQSGRNGLIVNGPTAVPSGEEGFAAINLFVSVGWQYDGAGAGPQPGEVWGSKGGEWFLCRGFPGYKVAAAPAAEGDQTVIAAAMDYNLVEFVEVTGCPPAPPSTPTTTTGGEETTTTGGATTTTTAGPDAIPASYAPGRLIFHDPRTDTWVAPATPVPVWVRDLTSDTPPGPLTTDGRPCRVQANLTGFGFGRPVYVGSAFASAGCRDDVCTTAGPTTTTVGPCTGKCRWDWSPVFRRWDFGTKDCSDGCHCTAPNWCPENPDETPLCTSTVCGRYAQDQQPVSCGEATTTTAGVGTSGCTTTTFGPEDTCAGGCGFKWLPARGWVPLYNHCSNRCPCAFLDSVNGGIHAPGTSPCEEVHSTCVPIPPFQCNGSCRWVWDDTTDPPDWIFVDTISGGCLGPTGGSAACSCDKPAFDGANCGQETSTPCYDHSGVNDPCASPTTTTTGGPGSCTGWCRYKSDGGTGWTQVSSCPGCTCAAAFGTPSGACDSQLVACQPTTAGPTTTTTSSAQYWCVDQYNRSDPGQDCSEYPLTVRQCITSYSDPDGICTDSIGVKYATVSGPYTSLGECTAACPTAPATTTTTTTTAGPTTTTTTTTAGVACPHYIVSGYIDLISSGSGVWQAAGTGDRLDDLGGGNWQYMNNAGCIFTVIGTWDGSGCHNFQNVDGCAGPPPTVVPICCSASGPTTTTTTSTTTTTTTTAGPTTTTTTSTTTSSVGHDGSSCLAAETFGVPGTVDRFYAPGGGQWFDLGIAPGGAVALGFNNLANDIQGVYYQPDCGSLVAPFSFPGGGGTGAVSITGGQRVLIYIYAVAPGTHVNVQLGWL